MPACGSTVGVGDAQCTVAGTVLADGLSPALSSATLGGHGLVLAVQAAVSVTFGVAAAADVGFFVFLGVSNGCSGAECGHKKLQEKAGGAGA